MERTVEIYAGSDGTEWKGTHKELNKYGVKKRYKESGYVGYLSGYRDGTYSRMGIMAFFKEKPTDAEIYRRRQNGFKAATWHWL